MCAHDVAMHREIAIPPAHTDEEPSVFPELCSMGADERGPSPQCPCCLIVAYSTEHMDCPIIVLQLYSLVVKRGSLVKGFMVELVWEM